MGAARTAKAWLSAAIALLLVLVLAAPVAADGGPARIEVRVIHATKGQPFVHPSLSDLGAHFKRFGGYNNFTLLDRRSMTLSLEETGAMPLPNGKTLKLIYRGTSKKYVKMRFILGDLQMNIRVFEGGVFFHGGTQYGNGALVLAVSAVGG
jgi:hypothetical protein